MPMPAASFDAFLETAWNDHGEQPQEVADRLEASLYVVEQPDQVAPFARLATHVFGEHLGEWRRGIDVLESLRGLFVDDDDAEAMAAIDRGVATLGCASGDRNALDALAETDRIAVLGAVAAALAGRQRFDEAIAAYRDALQRADAGLPQGSPALRALAVGGNNLAVALEEKVDRDAQETAGMLVAAQGGLDYWKRAGTWLEEQRAHYRLARSRLAAGLPGAAIDSAHECLAVCAAHHAPAIEQFFGYAALALAQRAAGNAAAFGASRRRALELHRALPESERAWCTSDLAALEAAASSAFDP